MQGYRTILFNAIMACVFILKQFFPEAVGDLGEAEVNTFLNALDAVIAFITLAGNVVLRVLTKGPVFKKLPPQ